MSRQANPLVARFGNVEDQRVFTPDEKDMIWELFFVDKYSIGHIASDFETHKAKIITVIESVRIVRGKVQSAHKGRVAA